MAMKGRSTEKQADLWIATSELARSPGHPFYDRLNKILAEAGFDPFVEERCARFYAEGKGRPSIPPGVHMRTLFIGFFEGIDSERGIAWRCADSLSLRSFLGYGMSERGHKWMRERGEMIERSFAHCVETDGMRRVHLRGRENTLKRYCVHVAGFSLSMVMQQLIGSALRAACRPSRRDLRAAAALGHVDRTIPRDPH